MKWPKANGRTCSSTNFLPMAIRQFGFAMFEFELRFEFLTEQVFEPGCCQRWFPMDFWSRSRWYRKSIMNFIKKRISRSNEIMDDALLRKEIWHCVTVSCRQQHLRMKLKAPEQNGTQSIFGWDEYCIVPVQRNASVECSISTVWNYGWFDPSGENLKWFHDFFGGGKSSDFTHPIERVKR